MVTLISSYLTAITNTDTDFFSPYLKMANRTSPLLYWYGSYTSIKIKDTELGRRKRKGLISEEKTKCNHCQVDFVSNILLKIVSWLQILRNTDVKNPYQDCLCMLYVNVIRFLNSQILITVLTLRVNSCGRAVV